MNYLENDRTLYHRWSWMLVFSVYALYIVYLTLHPYGPIKAPDKEAIDAMLAARDLPFKPHDLVQNLLLYIPFGFFGLALLQFRFWPFSFLLVVALGAGLSFGVETVQHHIAERMPSIVDFGLNTISTAIGAILALIVIAFRRGKPIATGIFRDSIFSFLAIAGVLLLIAHHYWPMLPQVKLPEVNNSIEPLSNTLAKLCFNKNQFWEALKFQLPIYGLCSLVFADKYFAIFGFLTVVVASLFALIMPDMQLHAEQLLVSIALLIVAWLMVHHCNKTAAKAAAAAKTEA